MSDTSRERKGDQMKCQTLLEKEKGRSNEVSDTSRERKGDQMKCQTLLEREREIK